MSAIVQVAGLLTSSEAPSTEGGYLDVLGERDSLGSHRSHQLFNSRFFMRIYERIWRPVTARLFFGISGPGAAKEQRMALAMIDVHAGDQVIDVGCGTGNYTRPLARAAGEGLTVGLDASATMVAEAAERGGGENLAYLRGDACALPFAADSFDVACSVGVIHMVDRPLVALEEMTRVLAPGGRLLLLVSCGPEGKPRREHGGVTIFARDEVPAALGELGMVEIEQRVLKRGQFVVARKPGEGAANGR
jgi:SAM-dependent methyltransferase